MEQNKCTVSEDGKRVSPCDLLTKACELGNPRGRAKGVFSWVLYNIDKPRDAGPARVFFGIKSGEFVAKGFAFNFCPFCGERIDAPLASGAEEAQS